MKTTANALCKFEAVGIACNCARCALWAETHTAVTAVVDINSIELPMPVIGRKASKRSRLP